MTVAAATTALVDLTSVRARVSNEEWETRVDLAAAYRLVAHYGWDDLIFTHISARVPGPDHHFLINPYGLMFSEICASNLVKVDLDGNVVEPTPYFVNPAGFTIHSAVHAAREDARCVIHLHTVAGVAVSCQEHGLLPLNQTAIRFHGRIGYHDYEGPAINLDERERIVESLGEHDALIMRSHGLLTCGPNIPQAFNTLYQLEMSCRGQVDAMAARTELTMPGENVLAHTAHLYQPGTRRPYGVLEWPAMLRLLEAEGKSSGYPAYRN